MSSELMRHSQGFSCRIKHSSAPGYSTAGIRTLGQKPFIANKGYHADKLTESKTSASAQYQCGTSYSISITETLPPKIPPVQSSIIPQKPSPNSTKSSPSPSPDIPVLSFSPAPNKLTSPKLKFRGHGYGYRAFHPLTLLVLFFPPKTERSGTTNNNPRGWPRLCF